MPKYKKPEGDIPYVVPGSVDPDAYEATSKEQKKARRAWAKQNQQYVIQQLASGKTLADLGITDEKEGGRSMYRMLAMRGNQGFQDPNFTYDWATGMKRNHATSNVNGRGWVPIEPREMQEYQAQQAFGTGPDAWVKRLQSDSQNQLRTWAQQNAVKGGGLRQDESGRFYMMGDNDQRLDFDAYGNLIDANSGRIIGDQYGMGTDLMSQARGYTSPYGKAATSPPKYADSPSATQGVVPAPQNTAPIGGGVPQTPQAPAARQSTTTPMRSAWGAGGGVPVKPIKPAAPARTFQAQQPQQRKTAYGTYGVF